MSFYYVLEKARDTTDIIHLSKLVLLAYQGLLICKAWVTRGYGLGNEKRCAIAKTVHGYETRAAREYRARKFHEMRAWIGLLDEADTQKDM